MIIAAFGALKMPFEERLAAEHRAAYFHGAKFNLDMRQRLGQMGFLAALSGFRAFAADILYIQAHSAWERTEWGRVKLLFDTVTSLQPRALLFWDMAAWHMAWNASVAARYDESQPREALRIKAQREYFRLGEDFLLRGIQNNPDRALLFELLGTFYKDKLEDHERAAQAYAESAKRPDARQYVRRFAAFELSHVPGKEREAYDALLKLYREGEHNHVATLFTRIAAMEQKLGIPPSERIQRPASAEKR